MSGTTTRELAGAVARHEVRWRWLIAIASALLAAALVLPFTAKPITWDEWVYMGLAFHPEPRGWVLNRYAHIYAMKPFMWLAGDPYVGARVYWSALFGVTVAALTWTALSLTADRARVLALTLFLLMGQETLFAAPGIAYADCMVMALFTIASGLVLARIARGADLSASDAAALGALFFAGIKAKETALPMLLLAAVLFITPAGRLRVDRAAIRLAFWWIGGVALAQLAIIALDGLLLGDPLFSIRPTSWRSLLGYNTQPHVYGPSQYSWLGLMLRPQSFVAFALYIGAGLLWSTHERDRRWLIVYALPALFLLQLMVMRAFAVVVITQRYVLVILPILCLLAALAFVRLMRGGDGTREGFAPSPLALAIAALLGVGLGRSPDGALFSGEEMRVHIGPALILTAFVALLFLRWRPRLAGAIATLVIVVSGIFPIARVVSGLASREVQLAGAARFAGFYQVARAVTVPRDAVVIVSRNLYEGAIRPGVIPAVTRMNFNVPLQTGPIITGWPPPAEADYAVVTFAEYQQWSARPDAEPGRAVVSDDREVAVICLRDACRRPQ